MHSYLRACGLLWAILVSSAALGQPVVSPEQHLGYPVGADFKLPDWGEVSGYYQKLAEQSPNVRLRVEGKTTEGRDFLIATISSRANLDNLDRLKGHARTIADPRGTTAEQREAALREGKVFLVVTPAMHSNEVGGTPFGMQFAYELASSNDEPWRSARENVVVFLAPNLNPDGLDATVEWYRKNVNTPYESAQLTKLYQFYTGHDNNRDWFMLTQAETRIMSRLIYREWRPQIIWDVHQQGSVGERIFVPPYRDPLNPNIDPAIVAGANLIGTRAVLDMTRQGLSGVATGTTYDMWSNNGNRQVPARHNMIGILTEACSANFASPIFQRRSDFRPVHGKEYGPSSQYVSPWPGGWWRLGDIVRYELGFARSLLGTVAREPRTWLANAMEANARAVERGRGEGVRGWIIPADERDPAAVLRLVDALLQTGIEIHVSTGEIYVDGRTYPQGSLVIRRDQPWAAHVKDLFEIQRYPKGYEPYDVAGWTLPLLMGVRRVEVMQSLDEAPVKRVETAEEATAVFAGDPRVGKVEGALSSADSSAWTELARRLGEGKALDFVLRGPEAGLFVPAAEAGSRPAASRLTVSRLPRIGIYAPWSGSENEGWLRWVFDTWRVPFVSVRNEQIRAGRLSDFLDVLILPSASATGLDQGRPAGSLPEQFAGGLAPEGSVAVQEFVRGGGTLITVASASRWAIELFQIPLTDVAASAGSTTMPAGDASKGFACPGSVLRSVPEAHRLTVGLPESLPLMFASGSAWRESKGGPSTTRSAVAVQTLLRYAPTGLLLSGYINSPETIAGHSAWVRATYGSGRVHLFGFQPHYRSWSQACFPLIFRAALLDSLRGDGE